MIDQKDVLSFLSLLEGRDNGIRLEWVESDTFKVSDAATGENLGGNGRYPHLLMWDSDMFDPVSNWLSSTGYIRREVDLDGVERIELTESGRIYLNEYLRMDSG